MNGKEFERERLRLTLITGAAIKVDLNKFILDSHSSDSLLSAQFIVWTYTLETQRYASFGASSTDSSSSITLGNGFQRFING